MLESPVADKLNLYTYFRSSAAFRVRIALNIKGVDYHSIPVHLVKNGGEHNQPEYKSINPQGLVPTLLVTPEEESNLEREVIAITQSLAIIEWLEETYPKPTLLPGGPTERAIIRSFAYAICCDIHPLNNLRVLQYLADELNISKEQKQEWYQYWIIKGFTAIEKALKRYSEGCHDGDGHVKYCFDTVDENPSLADVCLIPQVYNAKRFAIPMGDFPHVEQIYQHCMDTHAFAISAPNVQPDSE